MKTIETSVVPALLIALSASHGYLIMRVAVRHLLERVLWRGCPEEREVAIKERRVKVNYLKRSTANIDASAFAKGGDAGQPTGPLWEDSGRAELEKLIKTE